MLKGLFWIASYPRSGNTWMRAFLAALDAIRAGREPVASEIVGRYERMLASGDFSPANMRERLRAQAKLAASRPGLIFVKTHSAWLAINDVPTINENVTAGAVYLVRDPRDVAISFAAMFKKSLDEVVDGMGHKTWISSGQTDQNSGYEVVGSWSENVASWRERPATMIIRYEDLVAAPHKWFAQLARHLEMRVDLLQIARAVEACSFDRMQAEARKSTSAFDGAQIRVGKSGQWEGRMSAAQIDRIVADHHEEMRIFGYL
jgi:hypothetical protein